MPEDTTHKRPETGAAAAMHDSRVADMEARTMVLGASVHPWCIAQFVAQLRAVTPEMAQWWVNMVMVRSQRPLNHSELMVRVLALFARMVERAVPRGDEPEKLTDRQTEMLSMLADGLTNDQIARVLTVSEDAVRLALLRLYRLLGAKGRANAVALAFRRGMIT